MMRVHFSGFIRAWIDELGWSEEEITNWEYRRDVTPDGYERGPDGQAWKRWKSEQRWTLTLWRKDEQRSKTFDWPTVQGGQP